MQAASKRLLSDPLNVCSLAQTALDQVCKLASCCSVGKTAADIKAEFAAWWKEVGQDMLLTGSPDDGCDEEDCEEEEDETVDTTDSHKLEEKDLLDSLHCVAEQVTAEEKIEQLEKTNAPETVADKTGDKLPDSDTEEEEEAPSDNAKLTATGIYTLGDVLEKSGLKDFHPQKDDHESRMFQRVRKLSQQTQTFCAFVRIHEGILSRSTILGMKRPTNKHNAMEHALADHFMYFVVVWSLAQCIL